MNVWTVIIGLFAIATICALVVLLSNARLKLIRKDATIKHKHDMFVEANAQYNSAKREISRIKTDREKALKNIREEYENEYRQDGLKALAALAENTDVKPETRLAAISQLFDIISPVTVWNASPLRNTHG